MNRRLRRRGFLALPAAPLLLSPLSQSSAQAAAFPRRIALPDGFRPEGIAIGPGPFAYFGSLADGSIYRADLVNGSGRIVSQGPGTPSVGVKTDARGRLFVAGGAAGDGRVIDTRTGEVLASHSFASGDTFVNDVILAGTSAYFTDSRQPFLYRLRHGRMDRVPLSGDLVYDEGFNVNGIERTPDQRCLLLVQSNKGLLFRASPETGAAREVDLGGEPLTNGDGLLVLGRTLYVVQNRLNRVAVFRLNASGSMGRLVDRITSDEFDVPTTIAAFGRRLYLPNARFATTPTPTTEYWVTAVRR